MGDPPLILPPDAKDTTGAPTGFHQGGWARFFRNRIQEKRCNTQEKGTKLKKKGTKLKKKGTKLKKKGTKLKKKGTKLKKKGTKHCMSKK